MLELVEIEQLTKIAAKLRKMGAGSVTFMNGKETKGVSLFIDEYAVKMNEIYDEIQNEDWEREED